MKLTSLKLTALILLISLIFSTTTSAESPKEKAKRVKAQMASIRRDLEGVTQKYDENYNKLENLQATISNNRYKLIKSSGELKSDQRRLNKRVRAMYRYDKATMLDVVFSAKSWDDLLVSWDFVNRIGNKDASLISKVKRLRREIKAAQKGLETAEKKQARIVKEIGSQKDKLQTGLDKQKRLMKGIEKEIEALNRQPRPVSGAGPAVGSVGANGWVFPAASPYSFSNTWGAPRTGHTHKGTDIFASSGANAYAVVSGTVSSSSGGSAGLWITLNGSDGNTYWYMHMSGVAASGSVSQGQVIGYVGNTGNAAGGACHIHFEFHPGGGGPVNPYPYLAAASG